ncbi:hypothetical protein LTR53_018737, partial [Teratosphaeriaceae sp. CCFEE 6253]
MSADFLEADEQCLAGVERVDVADYTGPSNALGYHNTKSHQIDLRTFVLKRDLGVGCDGRRTITQAAQDDMPEARLLALPAASLQNEWDSLIYDDGLPSRLLRILTRVVGMMRQPGISLADFNWN